MEHQIIKIQKIVRGHLQRIKLLPLILYKIQKYLITNNIDLSNYNNDGRINSSIDENIIIKLLENKFKIIKPKIRMWYDILVFDYKYCWIPVNIKSTKLDHRWDNVGNLAMCVYAYTNYELDLHNKKSHDNGKMSIILFNKLKNKEYNYNYKKDYYFIVVNKTKPCDIIINSLKGLSIISPNINNLPFQICWNKNKVFKYENIKIKLFIECLQKPKQSWKEVFVSNMKTLSI